MYEVYEELGSIVRFFYENHNKKDQLSKDTIYYEEVPKGFKEPSIYFPTPLMSSNNYTTHSFQNSYTWLVKLFDKTTTEAQESAMKLVNILANNRYFIQVFNADNTITNRYVKIDSVDMRKLDEGVMQIELRFNLAYFFNTPDYIKFVKFNINEIEKEEK